MDDDGAADEHAPRTERAPEHGGLADERVARRSSHGAGTRSPPPSPRRATPAPCPRALDEAAYPRQLLASLAPRIATLREAPPSGANTTNRAPHRPAPRLFDERKRRNQSQHPEMAMRLVIGLPPRGGITPVFQVAAIDNAPGIGVSLESKFRSNLNWRSQHLLMGEGSLSVEMGRSTHRLLLPFPWRCECRNAPGSRKEREGVWLRRPRHDKSHPLGAQRRVANLRCVPLWGVSRGTTSSGVSSRHSSRSFLSPQRAFPNRSRLL